VNSLKLLLIFCNQLVFLVNLLVMGIIIVRLLDIYKLAWKIMLKNLLPLIGAFGGVYLFWAFLAYLGALSVGNIFIGIITSLLIIFFISLFYLGLSKIILKITAMEEVEIKDIFSQWNNIWTLILLVLLFFMIYSVSHNFFMFFSDKSGFYDLFSFIWLIMIVIVFILFFSFSNLLLVKHQTCFTDVIKFNYTLVKKNKLEVFLFYLLFLLINIIGTMFIYIGLIITLPLTFIAQAIFLEKLEEN
jgi:hypothetical protein